MGGSNSKPNALQTDNAEQQDDTPNCFACLNCFANETADASRGLDVGDGQRAQASESPAAAAPLSRMDEGTMASGDLVTSVLALMWHHANVALSKTIQDEVDPILRELKPIPLRFVKFDLGNVPVRTQNMFIHRVWEGGGRPSTASGVQIDVDLVWDGNCDIMLEATVSEAMTIAFGVRHVKLDGRLQLLLGPLIEELPIISAVQYAFANPPDVQLTLTGAVEGVGKLEWIRPKLVEVVQMVLAGILVLPRRMVLPVDPIGFDYLKAYRPPAGAFRLTVVGGHGFKVQKNRIRKDVPDVYCLLSLGASKFDGKEFRTSTKHNSIAPDWNESCDFILYDMDEKIYLEAYDKDVAADDELGQAGVTARDLLRSGGRKELELILDGNGTGGYVTLSAKLAPLSEELGSLSSPEHSGRDSLCGLVTIVASRAFDIPLPKEDANTCVKAVYGEGSKHEKAFFTPPVADAPGCDALNPMYNSAFHVPLSASMLQLQGSENSVALVLVDTDGANGTKGHGELGKIIVEHETLLNAPGHVITETRPIGDGGAKLEFRITLNGFQSAKERLQDVSSSPAMEGSGQSTNDGDVTPSMEDTVSIRLTVVSGRGFKERKRRFKDDVPDLYCNIILVSPGDKDTQPRSSPSWKTSTIKNSIMPRWNESKVFNDVVRMRDAVLVDVYDANKTRKDNLLGTVNISVEMLLRERLVEAELKMKSSLTGAFVTLSCNQLERAD